MDKLKPFPTHDQLYEDLPLRPSEDAVNSAVSDDSQQACSSH